MQMQMHCHATIASLIAAMKSKKLYSQEISTHSSDDVKLDHLTKFNAMEEIAQQKLQEIKTQQRKDSE